MTRGVKYWFGWLIGVAWLEESCIIEKPRLLVLGFVLLPVRAPAREPR